jgi:hypothetical protein
MMKLLTKEDLFWWVLWYVFSPVIQCEKSCPKYDIAYEPCYSRATLEQDNRGRTVFARRHREKTNTGDGVGTPTHVCAGDIVGPRSAHFRAIWKSPDSFFWTRITWPNRDPHPNCWLLLTKLALNYHRGCESFYGWDNHWSEGHAVEQRYTGSACQFS